MARRIRYHQFFLGKHYVYIAAGEQLRLSLHYEVLVLRGSPTISIDGNNFVLDCHEDTKIQVSANRY